MHVCIKTDIFFSNNKSKSVYVALQSNDQKKAVWRGGQPAARSGQRPWAFPQVHGHTPDQTTFWKVTEIHTHKTHIFLLFRASSMSVRAHLIHSSAWCLFIAEMFSSFGELLKSGSTCVLDVVSYYSLFMEINTVPNIRTRRAAEQYPNTPAFLPWRKK